MTTTVETPTPNLAAMPIAAMMALPAGMVDEALRRILPDVPAKVPEPKFNSTI